ncbi:MAG: UDP-glucose 4-epimerase GalE [Planctomycetota bacterium]|jgi:UDP-glucose-4-epimerase GalE
MSRILVTGGAGYIGSHTVKALRAVGLEPVVIDDLSEGHREALPPDVELVVGDVGSREVLDGVLADRSIAAVVHFAARCYVGESVTDPRLYYRKNLVTTLGLVEALVDHGVAGVLFSSTCSVYGETGHDDLPEDLPRAPVNPYGRTKAAIEWLLEDFSCAYPLRHVILRYFNAAGADPDGELGEDHDPETHLVPLVIREALAGGGALSVFGTDYPTPDGTCIRDYIHVTDLADAHVRGVRHLLEGGESDVLNLGTGRGHSVLDVIRAVEARAGREIPHRLVDRRPGDPARLVARPGRAREVLGWEPRHSSLEEIVETAYRWYESHPEGYA